MSWDTAPFWEQGNIPSEENSRPHAPLRGFLTTVSTLFSCLIVILFCGCQPLFQRELVKKQPTARSEESNTVPPSAEASAKPNQASDQVIVARNQSETPNDSFRFDELTASPPHRINSSTPPEFWDCDLIDIQELVLKNVAIIRDRNQFLSPGNPLLSNPDAVASGFDPAIQELGGPNGGNGVDQAQADFDPFFVTRTLWGHNELLQNNRFLSGGLQPGMVLGEHSAAFTARVEKTLSTGGVFSVGQDWDYNQNNVPARLYPSVYTGRLFAEYRQPLLAGAWSDFTSVAGPLWRNPSGDSLNQGVVIARINTEMSMYDFENRVQAMLKGLEETWWDLALAYATYEAEIAARDNAHTTWQKVQNRFENGLEGVGAADEAQARENYYERCALTDDALSNVYLRESQLRRLVGLNVNDGRLIRPRTDLETHEKTPDWNQALAEALTQRVELRRQKANLRSLAAQHGAAHNLTRPRLDFISGYQLNGFGDDLIDTGASNDPYPDAYSNQFSNQQTGWNLGFEFSMPIGFRAPLARKQNLELRLAKANAALAAQELEITHELAQSFLQADRWMAVTQSNVSRREAARQRTEALEAEYNAGRITADPLLRAQASLTSAEVNVRRSFAEYRKALTDLAYRRGAILDRHNVVLEESRRDPKAYAANLQKNLNRVIQNQSFTPPKLNTKELVLPASGEIAVPDVKKPYNSAQSSKPRQSVRSSSGAQPTGGAW